MNIKRSIAFMLLASFLLCVLFGFESGSGFAPEYPRVAIIIKGSESDFWNDVKKGAYSAATEFNIDITFEGPENEEEYETQNKMIENAVSSSCNETAFLYYVVISKYHVAFGLYNTYRFPSP